MMKKSHQYRRRKLFDVSGVSRRYFEVKIGEVLFEVEPPKLKKMRQFLELSKMRNEDVMENLTVALSDILSKNKTGTAVSADYIEENLNFDEMNALLNAYFAWVGTEKRSPN